MPSITQSRKRKAPTRDISPPEDAASSDEFEGGKLEGILSQSEDESDNSVSEEEEDSEEEEEDLEEDEDEEIDSDEIPSSEDEDDIRNQIRNLKVKGEPTNGRSTHTDDASDGEEDTRMRSASPEYGFQKLEKNYKVTTDANGNPRYVYQEIEAGYDTDDSDAPAGQKNTIGDIPLSFYDAYPHIGYDINGKKVMRPAKGEALDALLDSIEIPKGWTGLTDPATGKPLQLSREELEVLKQVTRNEVPADGYDPYPDMIEYFTGKEEIMPLSAAPEPKRRFVPSKHEAKRVMKIVKAIKEGRIQPYRPPEEQEEEDPTIKRYDLWADEAPRPDHLTHIPAPKLPPPVHEESYHPPPEYLPDKKEKEAWEAEDPEDREREYLPTDFGALRKVPGYDQFVREKFERCLDLYLAPRVRRSKLNIDPESLLPKLPSPDELRPFPTTCATIFRGHDGRVRSLAVDPSGRFVASGGDDGCVKIWHILTGRQEWSAKISDEEAVNVVKWRPGQDAVILSAAVGESVFLIIPFGLSIVTPDVEQASREILDAGWGYAASNPSKHTTADGLPKAPPAKWSRPGSRLEEQGVLVQATVRSTIKVINWHRRGEYFATVSPQGQSSAVAIHTLSKHLTQLPFRKLKGLAQTAQFHPSKPIFFVATQRTIRSYDLARQELLKILQPGARWISSFDLHPGGDNLIVGSYDKRLLWHDLDLSNKPYKTLRYHKKAIRSVRFHQGGLPLFADASDDGSLQIFHGKVVGDLMENATIVPLKVLHGHQVKNQLGVLDVDWHPRQPWCMSAGADGTCRLWN
ncbi:Ribosome biogenesis protein ERB1 [Lasiodiplodia hormozganensis]|uniref:Ribosome biogenesis protein ERB1 n=1 Tax=Lasiodiplodia hormozganensis TaxID=869390 RepID=A0AA40CNX1_9PEZI|nr:Ribosome biogenesis protein ERB1 [Lasiodiplodia hormozganensis]